MARILIVSLVGVVVLCGATLRRSESARPEHLPGTIVSDQHQGRNIRDVRVRLERKLGQRELLSLATTIRHMDSRPYRHTMVTFVLPDMAEHGFGWATVNFSPQAQLSLSGFTLDDDERHLPRITSEITASASKTHGVWQREGGTPRRFIIHETSGRLLLTQIEPGLKVTATQLVRGPDPHEYRTKDDELILTGTANDILLIDGEDTWSARPVLTGTR